MCIYIYIYIPEINRKGSNEQIGSKNAVWYKHKSKYKLLKIGIKGTPKTGLQIPGFHKQRNRSGGRAAQDR